MNISVRQIRAFAAVAQLGTFTRAADALHTTQPALSAQINDLEQMRGVRLFDRSTRSVKITQAGRELLPTVDKVLADLHLIVTHARDVAQKNVGRVVVAALPSVSSTLMPHAIAQFRARFPGVTIVLRDALADRVVEMIRDDVADFGLTSAPGNDPQLAFTALASDRMVAVLPRSHPLASRSRVKLADLLETPLILMNRESSVRRIVDQACAALGRIAAPAYEAEFMATAIGMVRAGLGATLLPSSALEITAASDLVAHPLDDPLLTRKLGILRKKQRALSPAAGAFVDELENFSARWFDRTKTKRVRRAASSRHRGEA